MLYINCPFDSGFGFKSNVIARNLTTPYLLIGSDDFDFSSTSVREGIKKLYKVLAENPDIYIASGRVNERQYEFNLIDEGDTITEVPVSIPSPAPEFVPCDLTVNFSLMRKEVFDKVLWFEGKVRIGGGEHGAQFVKYKRVGFKTVYIPTVNINEQTIRVSDEYKKYRNRALNLERPCFDEIGVVKYVLGDGTIDYDK